MAETMVDETVVGWELILVDEKVQSSVGLTVGQWEEISVVMSVYIAVA